MPTPTILPLLDRTRGTAQATASTAARPVIETNQGASEEPGSVTVDAHTVLIRVDAGRNVHSISPLIYGLSGGELAYLRALRPTLLSWGGNPSTRYNWKLGNAWNAGRDWFYKNVNYGVKDGISASDSFFADAKSLGIVTRLAIPTLGWVAKDHQSCSFPLPDGTCGDAKGMDCKNPGTIADPALANVPSDPNSIVEWMTHLKELGYESRFIAMDNEPELWGYTHYDVHPKCTTYEEVLEKYLKYATAVRSAVPQAELAGPVVCCWYQYWNSAPGPSDPRPEIPNDYVAWFLKSVYEHDQTAGQRSLDVLDVHYYPQGGIYSQNVDEEMAARRLSSTRSLWDKTYIDESWIHQPIFFIPRIHELIDQYYPGVRLGISEWNWGADTTMNGALAIADVLGIFGREDVYYAAYWRFPPPDSPGFYAFKLYTNYDDQGSRFGDTSIMAESSQGEVVSSYAALDSKTHRLQILLVNKQPDQPTKVNIQFSGINSDPSAVVYMYGQADVKEIKKTSVSVGADDLPITLPPYSITLIVIPWTSQK